MIDRNAATVWKLHTRILVGAALVAIAASGFALLRPVDGSAVPSGVVVSIVWIGYAIYALLASVFVALLGPTATGRKAVAANLFALVLAPLVTASVLTMRDEKPKAPANAPQSGRARDIGPPAPAGGAGSGDGMPAGRPADRARAGRPRRRFRARRVL